MLLSFIIEGLHYISYIITDVSLDYCPFNSSSSTLEDSSRKKRNSENCRKVSLNFTETTYKYYKDYIDVMITKL